MDLYGLKPLQALAASMFFKHKRLLLSLPRQEGKTELGVRLLRDITGEPTTTSSLFIAKDYESGKKATREKFMRLFDKDTFSVNTDQVYLKSHPTSVIYMASIDKDPARNRGGTYSMIHWSEVAFSKIEGSESIQGVFDKVLKPTLRKTKGYALLESTNNGKNGWYDIWNNYKDYGFERLKLGLSDLVYMGLCTEEEYNELQATTHPDVFKQEYECDWVSFQGRVYPEFRPDKHVEDFAPPEDWQKTIIGIDWGYDPSATAVLFGYVKDEIVYIYDEHYALRELAEHTADQIDARIQTWQIQDVACVADHEEDRIEELTRRNIRCSQANKTNVMGVRIQIKELFYFNKIRIHPRCKFLIRDLEAAVWHPKKEGELDPTQCTWGHFDAESALRYLIRELSLAESKKPIVNPHLDTASQAAFNITMGLKYGE